MDIYTEGLWDIRKLMNQHLHFQGLLSNYNKCNLKDKIGGAFV